MEQCLEFEKTRVACNLFDLMPEYNNVHGYSVISLIMTTQHILLHLPFNPSSNRVALSVDLSTLVSCDDLEDHVFDESSQKQIAITKSFLVP